MEVALADSLDIALANQSSARFYLNNPKHGFEKKLAAEISYKTRDEEEEVKEGED